MLNIKNNITKYTWNINEISIYKFIMNNIIMNFTNKLQIDSKISNQ